MLLSKGSHHTKPLNERRRTMTFIDTITIEELYDYDTRAFMELLREATNEEKDVA